MPVLGWDEETGKGVELTAKARRQGVYVIGTTGTGKTTLLQNIAYQDMIDPTRPGLCVLDPHGDFVDELLIRVPDGRQTGQADRRDDVILFDPGSQEQQERPLGLNVLECDRSDGKQVQRVVSTVISTLYKLFAYSWGPRMEDLLRNALHTLMKAPDTTLLELQILLRDRAYRQRLVSGLTDPIVKQFWERWFDRLDMRQEVEIVSSSMNKIGRFLIDPMMRNIVSQPQNAFDMRRIMDEGKILLVNLSKGDLGEDNSSLLGSVLVNLILIAALTRRDIAPEKRRPFHLIVDEYQSFATESFPTLQSEARKYGITIMVAHQYRDQLDELNQGSTLNVTNFIVMRVSGKDSFELASQFDNTPPPAEIRKEPEYQIHSHDGTGKERYIARRLASGGGTVYRDVEQPRRPFNDVQVEKANQLSNLPDHHALCRIGVDGRLVEYAIKTLEPMGQPNAQTAEYIRKRSLERGAPRDQVEADIDRRLGNDAGEVSGYWEEEWEGGA